MFANISSNFVGNCFFGGIFIKFSNFVPVMMIKMFYPTGSMQAMDLWAIVFHRLVVLPLRVS